MKRLAMLPICLAVMAAPAAAGNLEAAVMDPQVIEGATSASASNDGATVVMSIMLLTLLLSLINPTPLDQ